MGKYNRRHKHGELRDKFKRQPDLDVTQTEASFGDAGPVGGSGGAAPGAGAPPPADLAFDADLERYLSGLQAQGDTTVARTREDQAQLYSEFMDPQNPYNKQALLRRSLAQEHAANLVNMGSRGHLYGGGLMAADREADFQGGVAQDSLLRDYSGAQLDLIRSQQDTLAELGSAADEAIFASAQEMAADVESTQPVFKPKKKNKKKKNKGKN